jgi:hypothetical protein
MADRLIIDIGDSDVALLTVWRDGELQAAAVPVAFRRPLAAGELDELRWYLEDYLRAPYGAYRDRGERIAAAIQNWGVELFEYSSSRTIVNSLLDNQGYGIPPKTARMFELDADANGVTAGNVSIECD